MIRTSFRDELQALINRHSMEGDTDTPDFILADYMADCLSAFEKTMRRRAQWYGEERAIQPERDETVLQVERDRTAVRDETVPQVRRDSGRVWS